ncbi:hypothetical protein GCM10023324_24210 [Streptomyces youssoufiensis]
MGGRLGPGERGLPRRAPRANGARPRGAAAGGRGPLATGGTRGSDGAERAAARGPLPLDAHDARQRAAVPRALEHGPTAGGLNTRLCGYGHDGSSPDHPWAVLDAERDIDRVREVAFPCAGAAPRRSGGRGASGHRPERAPGRWSGRPIAWSGAAYAPTQARKRRQTRRP